MVENSEQSIFLQALELSSEQERAHYLDSACKGDAHLRTSVEQLLHAAELPDNPLDAPIAEAPSDANRALTTTLLQSPPISESPGAEIGPYRLMEQIGEGGFGLVFVASQLRPVQRKVALKIVKPGMDTREVIARFEAERQALAMMDHPNIAKVYDAGTTTTGRPYFVMELVRGIPITEFCDQNHLDVRARLELFMRVCNAVQHAHQKGVIHRDLKPSNVLVTLHDEIAVPKVIDFGVAKALGQSLTEKTIYTRFAAMIGTPLYMSPEQAEMSGLDVDTRSDIYSLGVLLYELLTGATPFARERFDAVGLDEVRRIIREEDPPKPSTRLTTANAALSTRSSGSKHYALQPTAIRGDLDWIVMRTLEKDRKRRYASVSELADDIRRFLSEEPISARPPSRLYQLQKFSRRNRVAITTATVIALTLIIATSASLWMASVAISDRNAKREALAEAVRLQKEADAAREEIAQFATRMKEANVLVTSGRAHVDAERWEAAYADFSAAIERQPNYYNAWMERALLEVKIGLWELAADDYSRAIELGIPSDNPANWGIPQLFLFNGDLDNHREYCLAMLQQAEARQQPPSLSLIRSCVIAQDPVGDPSVLAEESLAALSAEDERRGADRRPRRDGPGGPPDRRPPGDRPGPPPSQPRIAGPWFGHPKGVSHYITGLALYRAERFEEAVEQLNAAISDDRWRASETVYPALAMAYHRLGNGAKAREWFEKSEATLDNWTAAIAEGPSGSLPVPWFDWIESLLLYREASILLTGFAPADRPALRDAKARALELIEARPAEL